MCNLTEAGPRSVLTTAEMAACDRAAPNHGVASLTLMENAGAAVASVARDVADRHAVRQDVSRLDRFAILCGPGNNGGDGFRAAALLQAEGYKVKVYECAPANGYRGDAAAMRAAFDAPIAPLDAFRGDDCDVIVDALLGAGLSRAPDGVIAAAIDAANASGRPIVAVDVPSGLDGTLGSAPGAVVQADTTVTFVCKKPAHLLMPGSALCGDVILVDIGMPSEVLDGIKPSLFENTYGLWTPAFPLPQSGTHKYERGHAVVVSGPPLATGAARLAARGALRIGAGLVTLIGSAAASAVNAVHETAIMLRAVSGSDGIAEVLADHRISACLIGPAAGVGPETARDVMAVLKSACAVVLDADALTSFAASSGATKSDAAGEKGAFGFVTRSATAAAGPGALFEAIAARDGGVVLTPHAGEFRRLFGEHETDKVTAAREAARRSGAVVVYKGADTVIAAPDGRAVINANAPPTLATAGSGDVLAGLITGLLAQGMPAFEAACAAVWCHSAAARAFGEGLIAEDLPNLIPGVLRGLSAARQSKWA